MNALTVNGKQLTVDGVEILRFYVEPEQIALDCNPLTNIALIVPPTTLNAGTYEFRITDPNVTKLDCSTFNLTDAPVNNGKVVITTTRTIIASWENTLYLRLANDSYVPGPDVINICTLWKID